MSLVARSDKSVAPIGCLSAALKSILTRDEFFAGLYILGCANGLLGRAIYFLNLEGWTGVAVAIDTNVLVLFACCAGISGILANERDEIRSADLVVGGVFLVLVSLPIFPMSWLSIYILCFAKEANNSARKRGALILLALTAPMLRSRLLFQFWVAEFCCANTLPLRRLSWRKDGRLSKQSRAVVAYSSPKFLRSVGLAMCFADMPRLRMMCFSFSVVRSTEIIRHGSPCLTHFGLGSGAN